MAALLSERQHRRDARLRKLGHVGVDLAAEIAATGEPAGFAGGARPANQSPTRPPCGQLARIKISIPDGFSVGWIAVP
jgi:hypothetical protein